MNTPQVDLAVIGGGINGCGIAADAAGRGLSVVLLEAGDLACGTSANSSKLAHGGLRYLEQGALRLVREALHERDLLLKRAPHLCMPLRFCLPVDEQLRPSWQLRLGLWLYDLLDHQGPLPPSRAVALEPGVPLQRQFAHAFEYSDGWLDDARLVVSVALQAAAHGAQICSYSPLSAAQRTTDGWLLRYRHSNGEEQQLRAKALVNATGPQLLEVGQRLLHQPQQGQLRRVRGSHLLLPRLTADHRAFLLQAPDKRIVFVIPWGQFHLIGTTEVEEQGPWQPPQVSTAEIEYLCAVVNRWWARPIKPGDVVHSFAGVRPLAASNGSSARTASRDYRLLLDRSDGLAPLLSVFGGKLTTYRALAERAVNRLASCFDHCGAPWTAQQPLPGGDFDNSQGLLAAIAQATPYLTRDSQQRLLHCYGSRVWRWLQPGMDWQAVGGRIAADLSYAEMRYLVQEEWVKTAEDLLWRRTKLGLTTTSSEQQRIGQALEQQLRQPPESRG